MPPRKSVGRSAKTEPSKGWEQARVSTADAPEKDANGVASELDTEQYSGWRYHVRQQAGLVLGLLSMFLAWATFDENSEWAVTKMMCCLVLCLIACGVHEVRPYQRRNYGSVWWEQMTESFSTIGQGPAIPTAGFERTAGLR